MYNNNNNKPNLPIPRTDTGTTLSGTQGNNDEMSRQRSDVCWRIHRQGHTGKNNKDKKAFVL